jgi:hypothetical protein
MVSKNKDAGKDDEFAKAEFIRFKLQVTKPDNYAGGKDFARPERIGERVSGITDTGGGSTEGNDPHGLVRPEMIVPPESEGTSKEACRKKIFDFLSGAAISFLWVSSGGPISLPSLDQ